jgi:hypothetical protein
MESHNKSDIIKLFPWNDEKKLYINNINYSTEDLGKSVNFVLKNSIEGLTEDKLKDIKKLYTDGSLWGDILEQKKSICLSLKKDGYMNDMPQMSIGERIIATFSNYHRIRLENTLSIPVIFLIWENPEELIKSGANIGGGLEAGIQYGKVTGNVDLNWITRGGRLPPQRVAVPPEEKLDILIKSYTALLTFYVKNDKGGWNVLQIDREINRDHHFIVQKGHLVQPVANIAVLPDATEEMIKIGPHHDLKTEPPTPIYITPSILY